VLLNSKEVVKNSQVPKYLKRINSYSFSMPIYQSSSFNAEERFYAGFILNKLWALRYWCGEGRRPHLGHTSLRNLPKGRPRNEAGTIFSVADRLRRFGFIMVFSATGDRHVCACRAPEIIREGLILVNEFRSATGLQPLQQTDL